MTSSSEVRATAVLRGVDSATLPQARLWADLRTTPYARAHGMDARLVDPVLENVVAQAAEAARTAAARDGWQHGYDDGLRAGRQAAAEELEREIAQARADRQAAEADRLQSLREALTSLAAAAEQLTARSAPTEDEVDRRVAALSVELAEVLVGHHLLVASCPAADAVARALALVDRDVPATVRMHPDDVTALGDGVPPQVTLVADPSVERGGCIASAGPREVDAQIGAALARLREQVAR